MQYSVPLSCTFIKNKNRRIYHDREFKKKEMYYFQLVIGFQSVIERTIWPLVNDLTSGREQKQECFFKKRKVPDPQDVARHPIYATHLKGPAHMAKMKIYSFQLPPKKIECNQSQFHTKHRLGAISKKKHLPGAKKYKF